MNLFLEIKPFMPSIQVMDLTYPPSPRAHNGHSTKGLTTIGYFRFRFDQNRSPEAKNYRKWKTIYNEQRKQ